MALRRRPRYSAATEATALAVGLAVVLAGCGIVESVRGRQVSTVGDVEFTQELAIPPLAESRVDSEGRRVIDLTAQAGSHEFVPDHTTSTWGVNGDYLGPTLRARRGERVQINLHNALDEATTMHWHGMHLPAAADGGPHQMIEPGETWSPSWQIDQPAATLWYHPHPHGETETHVYRGLAGLVILDDDIEADLDLPRDYGVDDIPVIVQDKTFDSDGQLIDGHRQNPGMFGDTIAVNGTIGPYHDVRHERVRLRLLNGSTARTYSFGFSDDRDFALIGTDGGLLAEPHHTDRVRLSPGERAEIVVTMQPGENAVLRSYPPELGLDGTTDRQAGGEDSFDVLELRAGATLESSPPVPDRLVDIPRLDPEDAATTRHFELRSRRINGKEMDLNRIDEVVTVDSTEIWEVENAHGQIHNFHIHDVQFQVLDIDGAPPPPELSGWKDTILLPPRTPIRLIMQFTDHADPSAPYMFHCHLLRHEDEGMMGQFVVVQPGQEPGAPDLESHNDDH
jgi:FtsP/CotA-like multicopper oxidase with cupredoxin domain